ncbi:hypothetical protein ES705_20925 [subsurface metagenome]
MRTVIISLVVLVGLFSCNTTKQDDPVLRHVVLFEWKEGI